ncbi:hypothetical protein BJY01DRAFT_249726 [Aspergillus pseudoustus]|uniref:Transcription factor domain-containing protein n=1 Tax=Aspergillus pseudoustus TaxID=1810923 RepID=A0ABR4JMF4_9EURO
MPQTSDATARRPAQTVKMQMKGVCGRACDRFRMRAAVSELALRCSDQIREILNRIGQLEESFHRSSSSADGPSNNNNSNGISANTPVSQGAPPVAPPTVDWASQSGQPQGQGQKRSQDEFPEQTPTPSPKRAALSSLSETGSASRQPAAESDGDNIVSRDLYRYLDPQGRAHPTADSAWRALLDSAVRLARQHSLLDPWVRTFDTTVAQGANLYDSRMYPSAEFLFQMTERPSTNATATYQVDGITSMRIRYLIIVYSAACCYLIATEQTVKDPIMRLQLRWSSKRYCDNVLTGLASLDLKVQPEMSLPLALEAAVHSHLYL